MRALIIKQKLLHRTKGTREKDEKRELEKLEGDCEWRERGREG